MSVKQYPEPLGSVFLTGADGGIYEFPAALAEEHRVNPERIKELGHLPIAPYTALVLPEADEISARHFVLGADGQFHPHLEVLYGTAIAEDGHCYTGLHYHPGGRMGASFVVDKDQTNTYGAHIV